MHSYYDIIDYVPQAVHYIPVAYFTTENLYYLILFSFWGHPPSPVAIYQFVPLLFYSFVLCFTLHI